jgi:hypothetical protein
VGEEEEEAKKKKLRQGKENNWTGKFSSKGVQGPAYEILKNLKQALTITKGKGRKFQILNMFLWFS